MPLENNAISYAIGVDVGGTKIACGVVDNRGKLYAHKELKTLVAEGAKAVEEQILTAIDALRQQSNLPISGIGIGAAGQIDAKTGSIVFAPNLYWHNVPLCANIQNALNLPVCCLNDVRASTLAEWHYGAGRGCDDLLCVFVGTGIGGGVVSGGRLLAGSSNAFGEIGHMTIDYNGPYCTCGKRGCLEAFAGGWAIAEKARSIIENEEPKADSQYILNLAGGIVDAVNAKTVITAYQQGDGMGKKIISEVEQALVVGLSNLVNICNPLRIILGGGIIEAIAEILPSIEEGVKQVALKAATIHLEIVKAHFGSEAGMIGAATAALLRKEK